MRKTLMVSLTPYLYLMYYYNSYRAYIIFINGMIYHYNHKNKFLRYYDILCNFFIGCYCQYYYKKAYIISYIVTSTFLINSLLYYKLKWISLNVSNILHIIGIQLVVWYEIKRELDLDITNQSILNEGNVTYNFLSIK